MRQSDRFRPTCFMFVTANKWRTPTIIFVFIESLACIRLSACHLFGGMMRVGRSCDSPVRVSGYCWKIIGQISVELTTAVIVRRCRLIMCVWVVFRGVQTTNNDTNAFDDDVKQVPLVDEGCDESPMIGSINPTLARWVLHNTKYCTMDWLNSILRLTFTLEASVPSPCLATLLLFMRRRTVGLTLMYHTMLKNYVDTNINRPYDSSMQTSCFTLRTCAV